MIRSAGTYSVRCAHRPVMTRLWSTESTAHPRATVSRSTDARSSTPQKWRWASSGVGSMRSARGSRARRRVECGSSRFAATTSSANRECRTARRSATFARRDLVNKDTETDKGGKIRARGSSAASCILGSCVTWRQYSSYRDLQCASPWRAVFVGSPSQLSLPSAPAPPVGSARCPPTRRPVQRAMCQAPSRSTCRQPGMPVETRPSTRATGPGSRSCGQPTAAETTRRRRAAMAPAPGIWCG